MARKKFLNDFIPQFEENMELTQLLGTAFEQSSAIQWYLANRALPSSNNNRNLSILKDFSIYRGKKVITTRNEYDVLIRMHHGLSGIDFFSSLYIIINSMPSFHGPADWLALPLTGFNFIFGHLFNLGGFLLKYVGDALTFTARNFFLNAINIFYQFGYRAPVKWLKNTFILLFRGDFHFIITAFVALGSVLLTMIAIPLLLLAALIWMTAQPTHIVSNMIHYIRCVCDSFTNLVVSLLVAPPLKLIYKILNIQDDSTYADVFYSIDVLAKNLLLLAPVALLIAVSIVPFAGPVGAVFGSVLLHAGITSGASILNLAALMGLGVLWQSFSAAVNAFETFCTKVIMSIKGLGFDYDGPRTVSASTTKIARNIALDTLYALHSDRQSLVSRLPSDVVKQVISPYLEQTTNITDEEDEMQDESKLSVQTRGLGSPW